MIAFNHIEKAYFIGIGGIGMSAIARFFLAKGIQVAGYDKTPTALTLQLEKEGAKIIYTDTVKDLASEFSSNKSIPIIYTPAIPSDSNILRYFTEEGFSIFKRSEVLRFLSKDYFTIAVAGTHGKTSTTACLAHLLHAHGSSFTAFIGGIAANFNSNFVSTALENPEVFVTEADEYDRSFLQLSPNIAIITSIEADHLDIYATEDEIFKAYQLFANQLVSGGTLILHESVEPFIQTPNNCAKIVYGTKPNCDFQYTDIQIIARQYSFELKGRRILNGTPGEYNIANACAALCACAVLGFEAHQYLSDFKGVKRRFQTIFQSDNATYIDDYAHHPSELEAAIQTAIQLYPERELTVIFQPHLFSRTRDLKEGFIAALSKPQHTIVMPIYPAREKPIAGVDAYLLASQIFNSQVLDNEECLAYINDNKPQLLLTLGAGDIDLLVEPICKIYAL